MKKFLKVLLIILIVVGGGYSIWMATLPASYEVSRSLSMNAPAAVVFEQVNTVKNWENWSAWMEDDTTIVNTYEGPASGPGAKWTWNGEKSSTGTMELMESVPHSSLAFDMTFGKSVSKVTCTFAEENGVTTATLGLAGEVGFFQRFMSKMMDVWIGPYYERGLNNIKEIVESMPKAPEVAIEMTEVEAMPYYGIKTEDLPMDQMNAEFFGTNYGKIMAYMGENGIEAAGAPFAIYYKWDKENQVTTLEPGVPVAEQGEGNDEVKGGMTYAGPVLHATYTGPYAQSESVHEAISAYMRDNNITFGDIVWEVYANDPQEVPEEELITEIYYAIKSE